MDGSGRLAVVIVDDQVVFREGLRVLLGDCPDIGVVAATAAGPDLLETVARTRPRVVVLDPYPDRGRALDGLLGLSRRHPDVGVLVLTTVADDALVRAALRAGVRGFLLKDAHPDHLIQAIRAVGAGAAMFGAPLAARLCGYLAGDGAPVPFPHLTIGERAVLDMLAAGLSNPEIARSLALSPKTIRNRVSTIFTKIQVPDRAQAIVRARQAGLGETGGRLSPETARTPGTAAS